MRRRQLRTFVNIPFHGNSGANLLLAPGLDFVLLSAMKRAARQHQFSFIFLINVNILASIFRSMA
jgi:hypothetical protein